MTGWTAPTVAVSVAALSDLILAVHAATEQRDLVPSHRWRYDNVIGIGAPRLRDLPLQAAHAKHGGTIPVAALTVITHNKTSVDVLFEVDDAQARALFLCATVDSDAPPGREKSWARFLAEATSATLGGSKPAPVLRHNTDDTE